MKTESDVRDDLYSYIKTTELNDAISGRIFKYEEERPEKSMNEDIVIAPLTETPFDEIQEVIVLIRLYVKDLFDSGNNIYRADSIRLKVLETLCKETFLVFRTEGARCVAENIKTFKSDSTHEHCIVSRINYKFCNY
ncbi:MAG: hypothetical protein K2H76_06165 [Muribaculaceae bacterium]|nr:hypothetical protein [Muribaculaceae bacterium]MDE6028342.1 hypothetical protein [Muribaculaceae bacterium]